MVNIQLEIKKKKLTIDPWSLTEIKNYSILIDEFGIEPIENIIDRIPSTNKYFRRQIIFGHTELTKILDALEDGNSYAVMSGIKPTGPFHLGSKMTAEEIIFFQKLSSKSWTSYSIADYEAYADNKQSYQESFEIAIDNVADILALGLDYKRAYIYRQSTQKRVIDLALTFARDVTYNMMEAIYGDKAFGLYLSALIQVGDILLPELSDFGGPQPVVVPIGADQAPHIRLTRDLARKYQRRCGFILPSATYHKLIRSLTGSFKMSKREPMGIFYLNDEADVAKKKIMEAFSGGRETIKLQKELGGEPWRCVVYELYVYHFSDDDNEVKNVYEDCTTGKKICGDCKAHLAKLSIKFLKNHQSKKTKFIDTAREILEESSPQ